MSTSINSKVVLSSLAVVAIAVGVVLFAPGSDAVGSAAGHPENADVVVYKSEYCGCCQGWVEHMKETGLEVSVVTVTDTTAARETLGIPNKLGSCHSAKVGDYFVEGHVPADLVQQLMTEQPADILGIAAPGMPPGSPGMPAPHPREFDIIALHTDGSTSVYATRQGTVTGD